MTTLARFAIVAASFLAFPTAVVSACREFDYTTTETVVLALLTLPTSAVIAICVAASFGKTARTLAVAERIQTVHSQKPTCTDTTGETR